MANSVKAILGEVSKAIIGKHEVMTKVAIGILANGHILFEDFPGL
ncbi:MAG: magnesium chelatase, partial [Thermoplasmata archaeon]|nr:magnesium chelatase [Thermoplasmata archaeon]NIY02204.1 magnesium chelatase [Thermoplasmata archaeon]